MPIVDIFKHPVAVKDSREVPRFEQGIKEAVAFDQKLGLKPEDVTVNIVDVINSLGRDFTIRVSSLFDLPACTYQVKKDLSFRVMRYAVESLEPYGCGKSFGVCTVNDQEAVTAFERIPSSGADAEWQEVEWSLTFHESRV